ncbi:NF038215 family lipoprotein [Acinetobacter sp. NCu2D-2]
MAACDQKDSLNQPKTQTRTMIIGGVPVHDHDYQLLADNVSTEPKQTTRY